jgi:c-di-GMP-binding flagellar brake protein YcgR
MKATRGLEVEDSTAHPERRSHPRYEVDASITIAVVNHGSNLSGRLFEISLDGCGVRIDRNYPLPSPVRVEVIFKINGIAFRIGGTLQWTDNEHCAGIHFATMAPRRLEALVELLDELQAEQAAKAAKEEAEHAAAEQLLAEQLQAAAQLLAAAAHLPGPEPAEAPVIEQLQVQNVAAPPRLAAPMNGRLPLLPAQSAAPLARPAPKPAPRVEFSHHPRIELVRAPKAETKPAPEPKPQNARPARVVGRERRAQARHSVDTHAVIYLIDVAARIPGRILDLSISGCRIRADERFPVGIYRRVETEFKVDGLPFRLAGVVQSLHDKFNVGIRFLDMSPRKRDQLTQLMEEIEEMRRNPPANPELVEAIPIVGPGTADRATE